LASFIQPAARFIEAAELARRHAEVDRTLRAQSLEARTARVMTAPVGGRCIVPPALDGVCMAESHVRDDYAFAIAGEIRTMQALPVPARGAGRVAEVEVRTAQTAV